MWHDNQENESLWEALYRLNDLPAVSDFTREFYGLLVEWTEAAAEAETTALVLRLLELDIRHFREVERRHEALEPLAPEAETQERRQIGLEVLYDQARALGPRPARRAEAVRHLIVAECAYYLERTEALVAHLEAAMDAGAADPLVYFALGYARYTLALTCFVKLELPGTDLTPVSPDAVRQICLAAAAAFEGALTGGPGDAEVLWWMGRALLTAEYEAEAHDLLAQAERLAARVSTPPADATADEPPAPSEPLSELELERFAEALKHPHPISHLL